MGLIIAGNKTSNYMISLDIKNPKAQGQAYLGKVRAADKKKNEYYVFDSGINPNENGHFSQWRKTL